MNVISVFVIIISTIHLIFMVIRWVERDTTGIVYAGMMGIITLLSVISIQLDQLFHQRRKI